VLMALDTKMIPSMQVDFSVSSQEAKVEGTTGNFKESGMFMVGSRQWKLRCYPSSMKDHKWMHVPDDIVIVLVPLHKSRTCLVAAMKTHTHTWRYGRIILLFVKPVLLLRRCEYYCV
jgi:hypothetical protein